jgi:hypothetical protein
MLQCGPVGIRSWVTMVVAPRHHVGKGCKQVATYGLPDGVGWVRRDIWQPLLPAVPPACTHANSRGG